MDDNLEKKKLNNKIIILVIFLVLVILGLVLYIIYDKRVSFNNKTTTEEKSDKNVKKDTSNVTSKITDANVIKNLNIKIDQLSGRRYDATGEAYADFVSFEFNFDLLKKSILSDDEKLLLVLNELIYSSKRESVNGDVNKIFLPSNYESYRSNIKFQINVSDVNELYNSLFGTTPINKTISGSNCPMLVYNDDEKVYYVVLGCDGTSASSVISYKNNYVKNGDFAYVDVYYGVTAPDNNSSLDNAYNLYNSLNDNIDAIMSITPYKSGIVNDSQSIIESNYKDFEKYKYTFKLDKDNNYTFVKVEKDDN